MAVSVLTLPADPALALQALVEASTKTPTFVFKKSPRCSISFAAEDEWRDFLNDRGDENVAVAEIDVVNEKPLARGLTELLGIKHESPQALVFRNGKIVWHDSHDRLTEVSLTKALDAAK